MAEQLEQRPNTSTIDNAALIGELQVLIHKLNPQLSSKAVVIAAHNATAEVRKILQGEIEDAQKSITPLEDNSEPELLSLPPEIRNYIWELCVLHRKAENLCNRAIGTAPSKAEIPVGTLATMENTEYGRRVRDRNFPALQPAITKVNRQVRDEALSLFYGSNHFELELVPLYAQRGANPSFVTKWLEAIGPQNAKHLKRVTWRLPEKPVRPHVRSAARLFRSLGVPDEVVDELVWELGSCG